MSWRSLLTLDADSRGTIQRVNVEFALRERLAALGLKPGRCIQIVRRLGANGPLQVRVDHTDVVLRAADAALIEIANGS
jgi:ferrous iron transport protein A